MNAEHIYETMMGECLDPMPGIANEFAEGEPCARLYGEIFDANCRLGQRLGGEEDPDVEIILDNFFALNRRLCLRMFEYGRRFSSIF